MRTQSAGTGFVAGAFFSVLAALAAGEVLAAGEAEAGVVLAAGFCEQPPAKSAIAPNRNRNFFIDPPGVSVFVWGISEKANLSEEDRLIAGSLRNSIVKRGKCKAWMM